MTQSQWEDAVKQEYAENDSLRAAAEAWIDGQRFTTFRERAAAIAGFIAGAGKGVNPDSEENLFVSWLCERYPTAYNE